MHSLFAGALPEQHVVPLLPRDEAGVAAFDAYLARHGEDLAAVIVEPLVQGAGGMRFHGPETLRALREACDRHGLLLIADEIMTGFGRTGTMFACEQAEVVPDIVTLSKALTGGTMALAATVASERVFEAFLSDDPDAALMHGPTFMANPLACAAANASLDLFDREPRLAQARAIEGHLKTALEPARALPGVVDVRARGAIGVIQLDDMSRIGWLKARFRRSRCLGPPLRRYCLRDARVYHRRGRPNPPHGRADRCRDGVVKGAVALAPSLNRRRSTAARW